MEREDSIQELIKDRARWGRIFCFVDFGNVNYWYERDARDELGRPLPQGTKLVVDIEKLGNLTKQFSDQIRFYFGLDSQNQKSLRIITKARASFDKVVTKPIQFIKHYVSDGEVGQTTRLMQRDGRGRFVLIPKCNFDVEICVDASRFLPQYDTFCLWSSDADFSYLVEFLRRRGKKIILVSSGYVSYMLKQRAHLHINSQQVKSAITFIKQKPRL